MPKIKPYIGLAVMMITFAVVVAPAGAFFESNNAKFIGPIKTFPELVVFKTTATGASLECKNSTGMPEGEWEIRNASEALAKVGPNEQLKIKKWGTCEGPVALPIKVACSLEIKQPTRSSNEASGTVYPGCELRIENGANRCVVKIARQPHNEELKAVNIENVKENEVEIGANVTAMTATIEETGSLCKTLTITAGTTGTFKTKNPYITEGQKLV
jgi:hypothetical protein